jgi:hypothetical protein
MIRDRFIRASVAKAAPDPMSYTSYYKLAASIANELDLIIYI